MINTFGKFLVFLGIIFIGLGILFVFGGKISWFGKLPGDILIERKKFSFYFPIATCLLLSFLLSLVLWFINRLMR